MACRTLPRLSLMALALALTLAYLHLAVAQNSPADYLDAHNAAREEVGVEPLRWDSRLARYAQSYAEKRRGDCRLTHSHGPYGENIFMGGGYDYTAYDAVQAWVSERQYYDYESNSCDSYGVCGHYTQVVWSDTKRVGCGRVRCLIGAYFIVCSYDPPGNVEGQRPYAIST